MSYVSSLVRPQFDTLAADLKDEILSRNVHLENLNDLIFILEKIVAEAEA